MLPGNDELGLIELRVTETADRLAIEGLDARGAMIATLQLRLGHVELPDEQLAGEGRELEVNVRGIMARHASVGGDLPQLPLPEADGVRVFVRDPNVASRLARWGIVFAPPSVPLALAPESIDYAHGGSCAGFIPGCSGTPYTSCCMQHADGAGERLQKAVCGALATPAYNQRICKSAGASTACGLAGGNGCAVCWTSPYDATEQAWRTFYTASTDACTHSPHTYLKASNPGQSDELGREIAISADGNTMVVGARFEDSAATGVNGNQASNAATDAGAAYVYVRSGNTWTQQAYLKASNTAANNRFGSAVAISADGDTIAIGAPGEKSMGIGPGSSQTQNDTDENGAVYVFIRSGSPGTWSQQAYIKASNTLLGSNPRFGTSVALSGDSNTLAVGADGEDSTGVGPGGSQNSTDANNTDSGAVYVFTRSGFPATWSQQQYIKSMAAYTSSRVGDAFGGWRGVSLSEDGNELAVGVRGDDSNASGTSGSYNNNSASNAGGAFVFTRSVIFWSFAVYLKPANPDAGDQFGGPVVISGDGHEVAIGALSEQSNATGVNGDDTDDSLTNAGAVYVFSGGGAWSQTAYLKASNTDASDLFGTSIAMSADGRAIVIGASGEASSATFTDGDQTNNAASAAGAVYSFVRPGATWSQDRYIKASNTDAGDLFGYAVAMDADGELAVGAAESSSASGIDGNEADNSLSAAGAVYHLD